MENRINISELLKDCPEGMELDCTVLEGLEFDGIVDSNYAPIRCRVKNPNGGYYVYNFTKYGCWLNTTFAKCVIFPKNKNTWEGFHRPFEDGDVVVAEDAESFQLFLLKHLTHSEDDNSYDGYCYFGWDLQSNKLFEEGIWGFNRLASEEEKQKLFDAIKANGFKWNHKTKTLEKLPKFKVDNKIKLKGGDEIGYVTQVTDCYFTIKCKNNTHCWPIERQDAWELVTEKFDITTLKPFESKVLMRSSNAREWVGTFYSHYSNNKFYGCGMCCDQCIPYNDDTKHLIGKTDDCNEYFKIWE